MGYFLGIDGGGTHLRIVVVDSALQVLGQAEGTGINPNHYNLLSMAGELIDPIEQALHAANITRVQLEAVGVGIAGGDTMQHDVARLIHYVLPSVRVVTASDAMIALVGAFAQAYGVVLIAGTGSIAFGCAEDGRTSTSGGWGYKMGDEGSGYWIGLQLLRRYTYVLDGRIANGTVTDAVAAQLKSPQRHDLVRWMYDAPRVSDVAALAPIALAHADDPFIAALLDQAAEELVLCAKTVMNALALPVDRLAFAGGLLSEENALSRRVMQRFGLSELPRCRYSPTIGAAIMAMKGA
jgi:N-acetylglucosamine kinase-like BadF-type ATPase